MDKIKKWIFRNGKRSLTDGLLMVAAGVLVACIVIWYVFMPGDVDGNDSDGKRKGNNEEYTQSLVVTNLDVGKADCCVIQFHKMVGIIDTGTKSEYDTICDFLDEHGISSIDFMILTHYDKDHVGSAKKLIKHYNISRIITADYTSSKANYEPLQETFKKKNYVDYISALKTYQFDGITLNVMPASDEEEMEREPDSYDNNMSLVVMLSYGINKMLFTGDIEGLRIEELETDGYDLDADWVKIPHHGAYDSAQEELLDMVTPTYAVISTSKGHAADANELTMLKNDSVEYYVTSEGNVTTTCDGISLKVEQ